MIPSTKDLKQTKANGVVLKDAYICGNYKEMYLTKCKVLLREDVGAREEYTGASWVWLTFYILNFVVGTRSLGTFLNYRNLHDIFYNLNKILSDRFSGPRALSFHQLLSFLSSDPPVQHWVCQGHDLPLEYPGQRAMGTMQYAHRPNWPISGLVHCTNKGRQGKGVDCAGHR